MSGDKFDQLYNALKADGAVTGTREHFRSFVLASGKQGYQNRKKLYDALHADGAVSSNSYEEFAQRLGLHAVKPQQKVASSQPQTEKQQPSKPQTAAQMAKSMYGGQKQQSTTATPSGTDYMQNWQLMHKRNDQMTPNERMQANTMRSRMQQAQKQATQQEQRRANPISQSKVRATNPMASYHENMGWTSVNQDGVSSNQKKNAAKTDYAEKMVGAMNENPTQNFNEMMQDFSSPENQRARAVQQREDDARNLAEYEVTGNKFTHNNGKFGTISPEIDAMVAPSMKEADDLSWTQYQQDLKNAGNDAFLRNKAWKDLQDNRIKNRQSVLADNLSTKLQEIYSQKGLQEHIMESANKLNMGIEEYVDKYVTPQMMQRAQNILGVKNIEEILPKSATEYVIRRLSDSILGTLSAGQDKSKDQKIREQQAMAIADGLDEMPTVKGYKANEGYKSGVGARFVSTAANMAMDSPILGMTGGVANTSVDLGKQVLMRGLAKVGLVKVGAKLTAEQMAFKVANMTMAQKIGSGLIEGTAKGALNLGGYSSITSALGQASTGDDTSLSALGHAALEGFEHGAKTGAMFGVSGAIMAPWVSKFGINGLETSTGEKWLHGAQKLGATGVGLGVEAGTMMVADNITGDKDISVGTWLEDLVMVGAFKAGEPKNYAHIGRALYGLAHNTNNSFRVGKNENGNWRTVDIRMTKDEQNELMNSVSGKNLVDAFQKVDKSSLNSKTPIDKTITKSAYKDFMNDPEVSQSTKEKVNAAMGLFNTASAKSYRSVNDFKNKQILEYSKNGTLLTRTSYKNADERRAILYKQKLYRDNEEMMSLAGYSKMRDLQVVGEDGNVTPLALNFLKERGYDITKDASEPKNAQLVADLRNKNSELYKEWDKYVDKYGTFGTWVSDTTKYDTSTKAILKEMIGLGDGMTSIETIMRKDPMKRTDEENKIFYQVKNALESELFPNDKPHAEQSETQGRSVAEDNNLGTEQPNSQPVVDELRNLRNAEQALEQAMEGNDVFKQVFEQCKEQGMRPVDAYDVLIQNGLTQEDIAPLAEYINANARVQGMQQATQQAIEENVSARISDWSYKGELNGQKTDAGSTMLYVNWNGKTYLVGNGDVSFDSTGRAKEDVGGMLICLDPETNTMEYIPTREVTFGDNLNAEGYAAQYRQKLQEINSQPYNQAMQEQAMQDETASQHALENGANADTNGVNHGQENGATVTSVNSPAVSVGKGTENNSSVQENPELYKVANSLQGKVGQSLAKEEADGLVAEMENRAEPARELELTPENWTAEFGEDGKVTTPLGEVKMGENQYLKLARLGRRGKLGMVRPTLENPDLVIEDFSRAKEGDTAERDSSYIFVKSFTGKDGERMYHFTSVTVQKDGKEVVISNQEKGVNRIKKLMQEGKVIFIKGESSLHPKTQMEESVPRSDSQGSTPPDNQTLGLGINSPELSASKDTNNSSNGNGNNTTLTFADGSPVPIKTDSKGRPTPDYDKMTAEQSAEVLTKQLGQNAEPYVDAQIKKAEKAVKDAEKMKIDMGGEPNDIIEQQQVKDATIAAAHAQLEKAKAIKEALTKPKESVAGGEVDTTGRYEQERKQGYRIGEGNVRYDRQKPEDVGGVRGKEVEVAFSPTEKVKGHAKLVELDTVQASHSNGMLNPYHFGPDWQPKDRGSQASKVEAAKIAANIDPQQITGSTNAFIGSAPSVNERHETIQGNNRVEALKQMYSTNPEQAAKYKQWLIDHAVEFGLNAEDIAKMQKPIIVNELPVDDAKAKELGQMMASGFESGGKRVPEISATINKIGDKIENLANVLLAEGSLGEDAKLSDLINQNANRALEYLNKNGFIDNTEYENLASDPTTKRQWLENVLKTSLFDGDRTTEAAFNSLPGNAQKAVLATFMRDTKSKSEDRIKPNIQKSFEAFNELNQLDTFKNAKNVEQARAAIQAELLNGSNNMYGEASVRDKYTNFELELAALYKGLKSQKELTGLFGKFFDAVQGATGREGNMFEEGNAEPISKDEAIEKVFGTNNELANDRRRETESPASSGEGDGNRNGEPEQSESQREVDEALKGIATEITKQTGIEVVTDDKVGQSALEDAEATDSNVKYSRVTNKDLIEQLDKEPKIKVYRAMQVIDGKLYPPMAAYADGKLVEANELGTWIQADEMPDSKNTVYKYKGKPTTIPKDRAIQDENGVWRDSKNGAELVVGEDGKPTWYFVLKKGKGSTGKELTPVPAAYNPYWHTSYSPLNDQFKSAWIRPNVVVVECEVPESELNSGYRAEHAKDPVGMTPWTAGVVTKQLVAQGHEGRKVMLSRWCKPVRILPDSEVAAKIKDFIGGYDVEIPENVVTPRQKIELEKLGVKIGKPEKGMNKNEQIAEAIKLGLQVDNTVTGERKEFRSKNGEVYGFTVDGKIYLDTKKMKPETPLHEYTHLWTEALRNANPTEWENVKKLFDEVDGLKDEVQKLYPELKGDDLYEEMITTFSGREGAKKLEEVVRGLAKDDGKSVTESVKTNGFIHKVKEALQKYWKGVADMLHIHFTSAEDVADKVLADWAKGVNPNEIKEEAKADKVAEIESKYEDKIDNYIEEHYPHHNGVRARTPEEQAKYDAETEAMKKDPVLAKMRKEADEAFKEANKDERPKEPSKDPMQGIKDAAESYHNEKLDAARKAYAEAKASGDKSDIKRTRDELKQRLNEHYKAQHMGLVQRRKEIAKEIGEAEAEKIDKPFNELDSEEREYVASQNPLTESEIRELTSEENKNFIEDAVDYINGNHGFAQKIAYLKIYEDVRNRHENVSDNSGTENGTQLDATDTTGSEGLGLGTGRESRGVDGQLDSGTGTEPSSRESERRESNQNNPSVPTGEPSDKQGEGKSSDMGAVPARDTDTEGSGTTGKDGNKPQQGGRGSSNRPAKPNAKRKPTAKQGTTWRGRTGDEIKKNVADKKAAALAAIAELKKRKFGKDGSGTLGMNAILTKEQMEYVPTVMNAVKEYGMAIIDEGIYKVKDWFNHIRETFADGLKDCGFTDQDIDDFVKEMWNSKMTMDDETHTIAEWCSIYGNQKLREKLGEELNEKYQKQMDAEPIKVKVGDRKNIEETLPFLLPQQQEDVLKAETQFFGKEHTDREHAYGKGYMFTNGTGTGKTYTGLGFAKRLAKQGKGRILFVTPSQPKVSDWIKDGKNLGLDIRSLDSIAKEKGTTATTESGEGMVITTYANMRQNKKILETEWDAVIYDESHRIMENKKGAETTGSMQHYMVTNRDENHCFLRLQTINPHYQKMQRAADKFSELRQKEIERIQKDYKQSHPSATMKDVINATHSKLPKDLNSFAPADAMTFPKLGKAYQDFTQAKQHYYNNVEPKLKEQAKKTWKNTKTIFLSATPFNTRENLDYAEGYIFKFPEDDGSRMSGRSRFYLDHFGAAYRYRYNRLESKTDNPAAVAKQEIAFSDYLQNTLGTMSGRIIDSAYDYSRDFPTVAPEKAETFNQAVEEAVKGRYLGQAYSKTIGNYVYGSALFETMKVANIIQRMKDHLDAGRKIVVFHRRVETKEPLTPPFATMLEYANNMIKEMKPGKEQNEAIRECTEFRNKYADLLDWEQTLDYSMPREQIAKAFGKDNVLFFSGKETSKVKNKAVETFNDDNSGKNIIVIQEASGKEGISLHDVTGNHQRVLITLGLPQSPITALQIEGRTYRIGNKSNAIFEYPILGLNSEMMLFGEKFNNQVSTTENLALGSQARNLRDSFARGVLEHSGIVPIDQQGVGGKEFDAPKQGDSDPFDDAVLDYYSNQKLNRNNREGIDYFPTPEPLGYKMMEWANVGEGDSILEPSAGHGAIARYAPQSNELLSIEPSQSLFTKLQLKAGGLGRKFLNNTFENYDIKNKHDVVVMNPPFGTAGATAIAHLDKAFKHLDEGGRVVALIPRGSTDKKFDKWYGEQKNVAMRAEIDLPDIVFQQAGTNVRCRVVVLDKITDADLRSKAGYPEKVDLSGHYDKIEDFFEDLRDVQMPDRIIDTQAKYMKKARTFKKDIEDIKGMKVTITKDGFTVSDMNRYVDYSIHFPVTNHGEEWTKENFSKLYENFEYEKNRVYNEHSKAALDEMKKLACKLAGMSEEEMQKYIADKKNGGTHFRDERGVQYSSSNDTKDVKNERIIPSDVDKSVSSQIEKKFDDAVGNEIKAYSDTEKADFMDVLDMKIKEFSHMRASDIDNQLKAYEYDYREWSAKFGGNGSGKNLIRRKAAEYRAATIAAEREMDYRKARTEAIRDNYGLQGGRQTSIDALATIFEKDNRGQDKVREGLFQKASLLLKKLGTEITVDAEAPDVNRNALGSSGINRDVKLYLDTATRTSVKDGELATTILHEMIHQVANGAINLVKKGKADGLLTPKQIEAVNDILDIYNKVKDDKERFKENTYGLKNEYELTAQMADPRQRKAMDLSIWDRVVNAAHELARKGDRSILQRLKDAVKKLFEVSDKDKMDKAINDIMDDFNETVDDISMNEIDKDGFANSPVKVSDNAPVVVKHVAEVAKKVGGKVNMVNSAEEVTNPQAKKAIEEGKKVYGWYDEKTGEVHLYMPNIHDRYTAEKTIWHEVVGHKGMRELLGEDGFRKFIREVWDNLDKPEYANLKKLVDEERKYNPFDIANAIEEGIARLAEEGRGEAGLWNSIKNKVSDFLHEIGYRIAPNTKDVKYLLWLSKNLQKNPNDPYWKMRAEAVKYRLDREEIPSVTEHDGMFHDNDGKIYKGLEDLPKADYQEATDGQIHFRTTPSTGTALDRYHRALNAHGYMFTESYMDSMKSLQELMKAILPDTKIEDIKSSENPYMLQNTMQGAMSDASEMFQIRQMEPLTDAMSKLLDAFDGKSTDDKTVSFNLYMIRKHGLERNRVFFVRDHIRTLDPTDAKTMQKDWDAKKNELGDKLRKGDIDLKEYYDQMDEWIRNNVDADFKADEHDYSGFHGMYEIDDNEAPYNDADVIADVMDSEAKMEDLKKGSVKDFWSKVHAATSFGLYTDYKGGSQNRETYTKTSQMFDWYIPLRKFNETTAEDIYGYINEKGEAGDYIGSVLMSAKGRKSLSETNILAQIGAMGNAAIYRAGNNAIKQAFMRFARNHDSQGLITESKVWLVKDGTNADGSDRWVETYPQIPDNAAPKTVSNIIKKFEADMVAKAATGEAKVLKNKADVGFRFERAKDKSQHAVDVMVNGQTHRFYINGNPRAAQALNGMLKNWNGHDQKYIGGLMRTNAKITRFFAQACTSLNPEFTLRNMVKDYEFSTLNLLAKEGAKYTAVFEKYYFGLVPFNGMKSISLSDFKGSNGVGLFAKYRKGTLDTNNKVERYFKEFMENGGETGFVQMLGMKDWTKKYKSEIKSKTSSRSKVAKIIKEGVFGNIEGINEVAENMARFATYCASRDSGRSTVRSAYDAKEVTVNFNRQGSGSAIGSFKNGEMSGFKEFRKDFYGFTSCYLRNMSMFFNAGIQSTNLLLKNAKSNPIGTGAYIATGPMILAALMPLVNQSLMAMLDDDEKDRNGVKDPYAELPDYVRRNNLCIYTGGGEFTTIPLAIETRAFYGLGDLAADLVKNPEDRKLGDIAQQATGQIAQLVPVMDYMGTKDFGENPLEASFQAFSPSSIEPLIEWERNKDWKGQQIERRGEFYKNDPAWERANSGTNSTLMKLNQFVNAQTNDVAKGNEEMLGNEALDAITNPSMLEHYGAGVTKGMGTFGGKVAGVIKKGLITHEEIETKDIPFLRSFFYTPSETSSMQRTKSKFYNYSDELDKDLDNVKKLKSGTKDPSKAFQNASDYYNFYNSNKSQQIQILERANKQIKNIKKMRNKQTDTEVIRMADQQIGLIMQEAVERMDKLN